MGLADPYALTIAVNAALALERLGIGEGIIPLSEAIIYVCNAEKSNSVVVAMGAAREDCLITKDDNVPAHLRDMNYKSKEDKEKCSAYKYPHSYGGYVKQQYLPDSIKDKVYYKPSDNGCEKNVKVRKLEK